MGKSKKKIRSKANPGAVRLGSVHPVLQRAIVNGAKLERGKFEVASVANPDGEVIIRGEVRRHKVVRRVPHFETLYRSKVIDRTVFVCLEWYSDRLGLAQSGLIKCGLDVSGGGGSAQHHVPLTIAATQARSDVEWARGFIPAPIRPVFDAVMEGETFEVIGARVWSGLAERTARRKAASAFKIAANHLFLGIGHKIMTIAA